MSYWLADSIYPDWPSCIKRMKNTTPVKKRTFRANQEASRKDVERLFFVMKENFQILRRELQSGELEDVVSIGNKCVILHSLIVRMQ